jgi:hypothetical protein
MEKHMTILGAFYIAVSAMGLLAGLTVFIAVTGGGLLSGDMEAIAITGTVGSIVGGFLTLISLPGLVVGFGLLAGKSWARILGLVVSFFNLVNIPFGTAVGIYGLWVLTKRGSATYLEQKQRAVHGD